MKKYVLATIIAGAIYLFSATFASEEARAWSYTNCEPYNSVYDVCTTWEYNFNTGQWEPGEPVFVFRGEYDEIDPGEEP